MTATMKVKSFLALLVIGTGIGTSDLSFAAERPGGVRVDVGRGGVQVETGRSGVQVDVGRGGVQVDVGARAAQADVPVAKVGDLIGLRVYNSGKEKLGKIEDLVISPSSGKIRYAVLSFGGFLGIGDKLFAVPWADLNLVTKGANSAGTVKEDHYVLDVSQEALNNAPGFDRNNWPNFADRTWSADVDKFYSGQRAPAAVNEP